MTTSSRAPATASGMGRGRFGWLGQALRALFSGALLMVLLYQIPVSHTVDIGRNDAAYTQGWLDPDRADALNHSPLLDGSDGAARWGSTNSALIFPQIGVPAEVSLRLRANPALPANTIFHIVLNGNTEIGTITPGANWADYRFPITNGLTKVSDVVIEVRGPSAAVPNDGRQATVLVDQAGLRTTSWPILPYPVPVALGALAGGLLVLVLGFWRGRTTGSWVAPPLQIQLIALLVLGLCFVLLYRTPNPISYPLRQFLPTVVVVLVAIVFMRIAPTLAQRIPALIDLAGLGGIVVWGAALLVVSKQHLVLSRPGVETDFSVFARRSAALFGIFQPNGLYSDSSEGVLRADGFYNLGYPFMLWLVRPLVAGNAFLAAQIVAALSAVILALATWWLGRMVLGRSGGLLAVGALVFSPLMVEYGLFVGTDMPFAALATLAIAALVATTRAVREQRRQFWLAVLAGVVAGGAFVVRHPGLALLPFGIVVLAFAAWHAPRRMLASVLGMFVLGFIMAALPQFIINIRDTGSPLFNQQAKNIWLAVYANNDFSRWYEAPNTISLGEVLLNDPARFLRNWATNLIGFVGAGGQDVSEFGRADQLRLLAFPLNWFALIGLAIALFRALRSLLNNQRVDWIWLALMSWVVVYVAVISVGLSNLRFVMPATPIYALGTALAISATAKAIAAYKPATHTWALCAIGVLLLACIWSGFGVGLGLVLAHQPADELAAATLIQRIVRPNERVAVEAPERALFYKYSAVSHLVAPVEQARYLLRPESAAAPAGTLVDRAGGYALYRIGP